MKQRTIELSRTDIERLPNYKKRGAREYSSMCPLCGSGDDRFRFWPEKGNWWCRVCERKGFVTEANTLTIDAAKYEAWQRIEELRKGKERLAKMSVLERLTASDNASRYHRLMESRLYWYNQGLNDATIDRYKLGYCPACPTFKDSPSHTIPITYKNKLYNIRHRLIYPNGSGKYRPEMAGLPSALFNADLLIEPGWMTILVEGEVKSMVLTQSGFDTIGVPGASSFQEKWAALFEKCGVVFIAFDPGAKVGAYRTAEMLQGVVGEVRICQVPVKPDDLLVKYGGSPAELFQFLMLGRKI